MDTVIWSLWILVALGVLLGCAEGMVAEAAIANCPLDYKKRVETCIMEAKVAPHAGGGLSLVIDNETITNLCDRGLMQKTIDCLEEIRSRCVNNATTMQELDRLFSVPSWEKGAQLLCEDPNLFHDNQDCLAKGKTSVMTCVLFRTQTFRLGLHFTDPTDHAKLREVTCSFAESIVNCLRFPLNKYCPEDMVRRVSESMYLFLPPFCLTDNYITVTQQPEPAVTESSEDVEGLEP